MSRYMLAANIPREMTNIDQAISYSLGLTRLFIHQFEVYFHNHPISFSIAVAAAYVSSIVLGLTWMMTIAMGSVGFLLGLMLEKR